MAEQGVHYMFSGRFDSAFLEELYANDLDTAIDMFDASVRHIRGELDLVSNCFHADDCEGLRRVIHKIKPLFGYVGLPAFQERVQRFENACAAASNTGELRQEYEEIVSTIQEILPVLWQELERMKSFSNTSVS
jgi:HPt (histidine-containing phosphotransfer) domain-containing protein